MKRLSARRQVGFIFFRFFGLPIRSVNFGPGFQTEPLITSAIGEFVQTSSQLNCNDFGMACRWRNGGTDDSAVSFEL